MPDTVTQPESRQWVVETAHIPPFSPGPSSPDSAVRPRRPPQLLDEKELMAQLRQVREVGSVGAGRGYFTPCGCLQEDGRGGPESPLTLTAPLSSSCPLGNGVPAAAAPA